MLDRYGAASEFGGLGCGIHFTLVLQSQSQKRELYTESLLGHCVGLYATIKTF